MVNSSCELKEIAIIGGGSFGTSLAQLLADKGHKVSLWIRNDEDRESVSKNRINSKYLKDIVLSENIKLPNTLEAGIRSSNFIVLAVPSRVFKETLKLILSKDIDLSKTVFVNVAKGIDVDELKLMSEVAESLCEDIKFGVITGPSHAEEVARKIPTTVVASSKDEAVAKAIQNLFFTDRFRVYLNKDLVGVQVAGALKNIIALGAGMSDGLGFGDNGKAALMTRGLAEIVRLGVKLGADRETFLGLTGMGDLIVTCTSKHSRNWKCGYLIGSGKDSKEAIKEIGMVVEGIYAIEAAYKLAKKLGVDMPITEHLYKVIKDEIKPREAVDILMGRDRKHE